MLNYKRRTVFFDLDGTLHQQDMFSNFLIYLLSQRPLNILLVLVLLPIIGILFLLKGYYARQPMSLLLWGCTFGYREETFKKLEKDFARWFRSKVVTFSIVRMHLTYYLATNDTDVWLITGSPQSLVELVYFDSVWLTKVNLIATQIIRYHGGWILTMRCLGYEKVIQLKERIGSTLNLYSGYSDSSKDNYLLYFCQHRWRVTSSGKLHRLI